MNTYENVSEKVKLLYNIMKNPTQQGFCLTLVNDGACGLEVRVKGDNLNWTMDCPEEPLTKSSFHYQYCFSNTLLQIYEEEKKNDSEIEEYENWNQNGIPEKLNEMFDEFIEYMQE